MTEVWHDETTIRLSAFLGALVILAVAERVFPRRARRANWLVRWPSNLGIVVVSQFLVRLLMPLVPVALAALARERGWGLFNVVDLPGWLAFLAAVLLQDMAIYWQHVAFHRVRQLWLFHRMHHTDLDIDVTTALRFHPVEILASVVWKLVVVLALGPSPAAVLVFEILLNGCAMFNHANLALPLGLDRYLRLLVVTPDMHRVHHSTDMREANSNYGFNFPWWDRLFRTYIPQPKAGHTEMPIGLNIFRDPKYLWLHWLLAIPFVKGRP